MTTTTLVLMAITGSMILILVMGGISYMRRNHGRPQTATTAANTVKTKQQKTRVSIPEKPADSGVQQIHKAAYQDGETESTEEMQQWENQLEQKLAELENRFAAFTDRLGRLQATESVGTDMVRTLARRGMVDNHPGKAGQVVGGGGFNNPVPPTDRVASQLQLSEEQMRLVKRISSRNQSQTAVGS